MGITSEHTGLVEEEEVGGCEMTESSLSMANEQFAQRNEGYILFVVVTAALTAASLGYDVGVMADATLHMDESFDFGDTKKEIVVGSLNFMAAFGSLFAGYIADTFGRKKTLAACSALYIIGTAGMTVATNFEILLAGRVVTGLGVGLSFVVGPTYISEITPADIRGKLASIFDISVNAGILFGYIIGFGCEELFSGSFRWRSMLGFGVLFPVLVAIFLLFLPESPRWLILHNRKDEAKTILTKLFSGCERTADECISEIESEESITHGTWAETLCPPEGYARTVMGIAFGLAFWQQITGSEAVLYYSATFLKNAGLTSQRMLLLGNMLVGLAKLLPEFWVMHSVDIRGRRWHLLISAITMTVAVTALTVAFAVDAPSWVMIVLLCLFMATFSLGLGPFSFMTASEIIPLKYRAKGMSLVTFINRIVSGSVALTALTLSSEIGMRYYFLIFAVISALSIFFYKNRVPETAGKSLEGITAELKELRPTSVCRSCLY
eukprot:TRINITY_DN8345_c0_g2_i1.p1 TRINITY_DN8345_c0_g2~~TRINITY_DN8345_c0_g2_i1.p1  ORF type:complete len:495 (+),score=95.82 TRINITY_DN8345_c0_g2_i1:36-1520(+)